MCIFTVKHGYPNVLTSFRTKSYQKLKCILIRLDHRCTLGGGGVMDGEGGHLMHSFFLTTPCPPSREFEKDFYGIFGLYLLLLKYKVFMKTYYLILFKNKLSGIKFFFFFWETLSFCDLILVSQSGIANFETI